MAEQGIPATTEYGGFWIRLLALLADSAILFIATCVILIICSFLGEGLMVIGSAVAVLASLLYWPLMHASARQATLGKQLVGVKVVGAQDGARISILRALGRDVIGKIISGAIFAVGYLIAAFTPRKQALHDLMASTVVVREGPARIGLAVGVAAAGVILPFLAVLLMGGMILGMMAGTMAGMMGGETAKPPAKPMAQVAQQAPKPAAAPTQPAAPQPPPAESKPAAAPTPAAVAPKPAPKPVASSGEAARGSIVIPGTYRWDARANSVGTGGDIWWQQKSEKERALNPQGRAMIANASGQAFDDMGAAEVAKLSYSSEPIPGNDGMTALDPGAVLGLRTSDGDYLKMRVVRYYDSHDFSFRGNEKLPEKWKQLTLGRPKTERYHIELEWVAYSGPAIAAAKGAEARKLAAAPAAKAAEPKPAPPAAPEPPKVAAPQPAEQAPKPAPPAAAEAKPQPPVVRPRPPGVPGPRHNDLTTAVMYRDAETVAALLAMGKWVDKPDSRGMTPLMTAVVVEDAASAELLLKAGANPDRAMFVAREYRNQAMQSLMQRYGAR